MPIDLHVALGAELEPVEFSWSSSDVQLYHLGLGAGADPMNPRELRYLVDDTPQVLPTFGNVAASFHQTEPPKVKFPGIDIELSKVLHASEAVDRACAVAGQRLGPLRHPVHRDLGKGKAAVIVSQTTVTDLDGSRCGPPALHLRPRRGRLRRRARPSTSSRPRTAHPTSRCRCRSCRSRRCCTGSAATATRCTPIPNSPRRLAFPSDPARPVHLRHRMQGDRRHTLDGDASRVRSYGARFAGVVFPGETLRASIWKETTSCWAVTAPSRDDATVLSGVELTTA